jgi:hypothetical protein
VLFHVTAEASWSSLPISGHFVDMLRRVVQLSRAVTGGGEAGSGILPPWRLLDANRRTACRQAVTPSRWT